MDERGNLYFGENPADEDVRRLKEFIEKGQELQDLADRVNKLTAEMPAHSADLSEKIKEALEKKASA